MNLNAIETAEALENIAFVTDPKIVCRYAGTMLRQQQAEIKTLECALAQLKHMNKNWQISENILLLELEKLQSRELTDEEIMDYVDAFSIDMGNVYEFQPDNVLQMIRAILDKAQEK